MYVLDDNNRCENCNPESFATARLAKQNALMSYLDARKLPGNSTDITIDNGICGKERPDRVYDFGDKVVMVASDRISAFDVVLPRPIPFKGQVLNQIAAKYLNATKDIVPNFNFQM
jgi:hypothetical protein